jgi:hypothetical protein
MAFSKLFGLSVYAIVSVYSFCAAATSYERQDILNILTLSRKGTNLAQALNDLNLGLWSQGITKDSQCLEAITTSLSNTSTKLLEIGNLIELSIEMHDPSDESIVNQSILREIGHAFQQLESNRRFTNRAVIGCRNSAFVSTRGQSAIDFLIEVDNALHTITRRTN